MLLTYGQAYEARSMPFPTASERHQDTTIFASAPTELETKPTARKILRQRFFRQLGLSASLQKVRGNGRANGSTDDIECTAADG